MGPSIQMNRPCPLFRPGPQSTDPLPDSTLVQRTLTPAPWFLFAGSAYLDAKEALRTPQDLQNH